MANYTKLKVIWKNNLNNIYKDNTIIGVGQEAVINIDEKSIVSIYVNFKVNDEVFTDLVEINGNIINVPFKTDVLKVGTHKLEIVAYLKNNDVVPSPTFTYYVEESLANPNDVTAETHYPILIEFIERIEGAVANENERIANEEERIANENERVTKENERIANENERVTKENERVTKENERVTKENERIANENERIEYEDVRRSEEIERTENENLRKSAEVQRIGEEIERTENENLRKSAEVQRIGEETQRLTKEEERLIDEQIRQNAERIREANEEERIRKEVERQNAEELRQIAYNSGLYGRMDEAEDRLNAVNSQLAHIKNFSTPEMFGAIGDGIADDTQAIQKAINNSNSVIFRGDKSYNISQIIIKKDCVIEGNGATINQIGESECIMSQGTYKTTTILTSNAERYKDVITLSSYDNISVGDILVMKSNKLWYYDNRDSLYKGETHKVVSISSSGITIEPSLQDSYDISTETVECSFYTPITFNINNVNINGNMYIKQNINTTIKNCRVKPINVVNAICLSTSYNTIFDNCIITDCIDSSTGYAIQDNSSTYTKVLNCKFNNNRRGVDFSGTIPARLGLVENCIVVNTTQFNTDVNASAFGTHGTADSIIFRNNNIANCRIGFVIRAGYCVIENNNLYGNIQTGIAFGAGDELVIRGNKYFAQNTGKDTLDGNMDSWYYLGTFLQVNHNPSSVRIEENYFEALRGALVKLGSDINKLIINRNSIPNYLFKSGFIVINADTPSTITELQYTYNDFKFTSSKYQIISENISYSMNKLICTDFPINPSLIVWNGSGTVTDDGTDLRITILPCAQKDYLTKKVNLVGTLMFTVEGSEVALRLEPLVASSLKTGVFLYVNQNCSQGVMKFLESHKLYISSNTENYNGKFSAGTYTINVNISYLR